VAALALSEDHRPYLGGEKERIQRAGGVVQDGRVDGLLSVSRALGDFEFKEQYEEDYDPTDINDVEQLVHRARKQKVSACPDVRIHPRDHFTDRFLVLACDGIWDVASNQDVVEWIASHMQQGEDDLGVICEHILDICFSRGSEDNMTIIVVLLQGGKKLMVGKGGGVKRWTSPRR
jgi:serine/threonine protein phosphatase PrpC